MENTEKTALQKITQPGKMTIGVELPLDNDFARHSAGNPNNEHFGITDLTHHRERAILADQLGFAAIWVRDVPVWLPKTFGDAEQIFEPLTYLSYLAGITNNAMLGTSAIVAPLRNPIHTAKMAATLDQLSGGRLILGVASGDRPQEYPLFGYDFDSRGAQYRNIVKEYRDIWEYSHTASDDVDKVLPAPLQKSIPLLAVGKSQQTTEWVAENMDGYFTYPRPADAMKLVINHWKSLPGAANKPILAAMLVDLHDNPNGAISPIRLGIKAGINNLLTYLKAYEAAGISHMSLNLRSSRRPVEEVMQEISDVILPEFNN